MSQKYRDILKDEDLLEEVAKAAFDSVDTDHSGQIDVQELEKIMSQVATDIGNEPPSKEDVEEILKHLDTDKSGKIDFNEFKILIRDLLEAMCENA